MKKILSLALLLVLLLSSVLGLASCGGTTDSGAIIKAYYVGEMYDFDPARAAIDDDAMRILSLLYEPLFTLTEGGKVVPALAQSYKIIRNVDEGDYSMEIKIRPTTWSDGNTVTAFDVLFAWKRIIDPDFASQAAPLLYDIENAVEIKTAQSDADGHSITSESLGVEAVNATTLKINFRKIYDEDGKVIEPNYDAFLRNLTNISLAPVRQSVVEGDSGKAVDYWSKRAISIVSNGPFTVRTLDYDRLEFTLERNRYYDYAHKDAMENDPADKKVKPYQLITDWTIDTAEMADLFAEKSIFVMSELPLDLRESMKKDAKVTDLLSTMSVMLNTNGYDNTADRGTALSYPAIRRALSEVLDRNAIADLLVFAEPATGFVSHGVYDSNSNRKEFRAQGGDLLATTKVAAETLLADPELAAALEALGPKTAKNDKWILTFAHSANEVDTKVAEYVKAAWESLGFQVILKPLSYNAESFELILGENDKQTFNYRSSQMIDAYEDFAIKTAQKGYNGKASEYVAAYLDKNMTNRDLASLYNQRAGLREIYFDALLVDYQMFGTDAFTSLAGFSSTLNGNGVDLSTDKDHFQLQTAYTHMTGFVNEEYDALIDKAYGERDLAKRAELLHEAEKILVREMPIIPLTFGQCHYVASREIYGISTTYYGYPVFTKMGLKNYQDYLPEEETEETTAPETEAAGE